MILMIEMNIAYHYGNMIWKNSILTINSGVKDDKDSDKNYSKLARALANVSDDVRHPSINESQRKFMVSKDEKSILYSLMSITGVNADLTQEIIDNRPYNSFQDVLNKMDNMKYLKHAKMINLIKGGMFNEFNNDRKKVMVAYLKHRNPLKDKLTKANIDKMRHLIPEKYSEQLHAIEFDKLIRGKKSVLELSDSEIETVFYEKYYQLVKNSKYDYKNCGDILEYAKDGVKIDQKRFGKFVDDYTKEFIDWLKTDEALKTEQRARMMADWNDKCRGSLEQWEFEALNVYLNNHVLDVMPINQYYTIENYFDMPKEPIVTSENKGRNGRVYKNYKQSVIAGTVTESDNKKGLVTIVTQFGVVDVRVGKKRMAEYTKVIKNGKVVIDDNWFKRGNTVLFKGYRRENEFTVGYNNPSVMIVEDFNETDVKIRTNKYGE